VKKTLALLFLLAACGKSKPAETTPPDNTGGVTYGAEGGDAYGGEVYGGVVYGYVSDDSPQGAAYTPKHYDNPRAECDAFVVGYEKFIACDKLPPEARDASKQGLEAMKQSWVDWDTWSPEQKDMAADGCHQALDAITQAAQSMGCVI
jgi:hypothetical protein